jgi:hypothetical protein
MSGRARARSGVNIPRLYAGSERRACGRTPPPPRVIGRARVVDADRLIGLELGRWFPVVDQNPQALRPEALAGYVWLDVDGWLRHVWAGFLEIEWVASGAGPQ